VDTQNALLKTSGELLLAARDGDEAAWMELVGRHVGLVWSIARSFRLSRAAAEDVTQVVWLRLLEKGHTIRNPNGLASWIATTARRECLATLRLAHAHIDGPLLVDLADDERPDELCLISARDRVLREALARLPQRDQLLLRLLAGSYGYDEISAALGMPRGSVGPTRGRALGRLRAELYRVGVESLADVL
jgi:RNA polymerase sigma factor (sigma-70 family)